MEKKRILIVDDNEFFIQQEISYLDRDRFDFHTAGSGKEALDKARTLIPDLILLDQIMSDMTGQEVCRNLKADPFTSKIAIVIVISGEKEASRKETALTGCDGLIFKPIRKDLLVTMVEEILRITTRQYQRISVALSAIIMSGDSQLSGTVRSLSADGLFVEMASPPIPGEVFGLQFAIPMEGRQVLVRSAAVIWAGQLGENGPEGVGVRFLTIDPEDRDHIDQYVNDMLESEKSEIDRRVKS